MGRVAGPDPGHPLLFRQRPGDGEAGQEAMNVGRPHRPARRAAGGEIGLEALQLIEDFIRHGA